MFRLLKVIFYLAIFALLALLAFAYVGPMLGFDFSAPQQTVTQPVELPTE